jgi:hypothetical protein
MAAAVPGGGRRREVPTDRLASRRALLLAIDDWAKPRAVGRRHRRVPARVRVAYGVVAALAVWLLLPVTTPWPDLDSAQAVNQLICALLLLPLAAAAGLGLCRFPVVRLACTLTGVWLMLSPLFLPGPFSNTALFGGLGTFGAAAWAAEDMELHPRR